MIVSTKGRYALRVMVFLAKRTDRDYVPVKEIAEQEEISQKYLESIMTILSKAGFLRAVQGKGGGYRLSRDPAEYTVGSIPVSCTTHGPSACSRTGCCDTLPMWEKLDKLIDDYFESITLADLLKMHNCQPAPEE